ncbi:MAG: YbjN domain-containing protein [Actinomycetota bacterium]
MAGPAEIIERYLRDREIRYEHPSEPDWALQLRGEKKHSITVLLAVRERTLALESFFIRRPEENHAELYALLLRANARAYGIRFALDDIGDIFIVARIALEAVTEEELDRLLGAVLATADDLFMPAIEIGFASYLARDLAWRAAQTPTPR